MAKALLASEIDAYVGVRIRRRREALGMSQGTLGRHLGLTFSQIQKYEKGTNRIGAGRLYKIAGFLGVSVLYFFEGLGGESLGSINTGEQVTRSEAIVELLARIPSAQRVRVIDLIRVLASTTAVQ